MKKIKEVIVVEGKNDTLNLKKYFSVDTVETSGLGITQEVIDYLAEVNKTRGIIVFTDPDTPGEKIRKIVNESIPNVKNAFIMKKDAKGKNKIGVEHANYQSLSDSLNNLLTYTSIDPSIEYSDLLELGLVGINSSSLRHEVSKHLKIGDCNGKRMLHRLNMLGIDREVLKKIVEDVK